MQGGVYITRTRALGLLLEPSLSTRLINPNVTPMLAPIVDAPLLAPTEIECPSCWRATTTTTTTKPDESPVVTEVSPGAALPESEPVLREQLPGAETVREVLPEAEQAAQEAQAAAQSEVTAFPWLGALLIAGSVGGVIAGLRAIFGGR